MATYITIGESVYDTNTDEEIAAARRALADAGLDSAPLFAGDPDCPSSYKTSNVLFAAHQRPIVRITTSRDCGGDISDEGFASYVALASERVAAATGCEVRIETGLVAATRARSSDGNPDTEDTAEAVMQTAWNAWCDGERAAG